MTAMTRMSDKILIWRKNIKDGRHDPNIFPNSKRIEKAVL